MNITRLPDWQAISEANEDPNITLSPLEQFIYDYEPACEEDSEKWRSDLLDAINEGR